SPYEVEMIKKNGELVTIEISAMPVSKNNKIIGEVAILRDVTERKWAEEGIRRAADEWSTTFNSITDSVSIHDRDFKLVRVNKTFADTMGMKPEELIGKKCYKVLHDRNEPWPNCPHQQTLETKKPRRVEYFEPLLGIDLEVSTSPIFGGKGEVVGSVHISKDITERKKMEGRLMVSDRLASIGELASGIAHELNNPLTSIIGFSELLLDKPSADDIREDLEIIHREAQRTAGIVKNLLTFARKHTQTRQSANINNLIETVLELRAYEQRVNNINVITRFNTDLPEIMVDYFQLRQVCLNIIINSEYFMIEAHNKGTLTITTEQAGDIIRIYFADDGPGISAENLGHLFDPFFTTKEAGKGTGLGLSICHGVVSEHGGRIYAESQPGKGATFIIELPISVD
ncbi:ATP-binding protein, partial [Chloroflexota bacterium]